MFLPPDIDYRKLSLWTLWALVILGYIHTIILLHCDWPLWYTLLFLYFVILLTVVTVELTLKPP